MHVQFLFVNVTQNWWYQCKGVISRIYFSPQKILLYPRPPQNKGKPFLANATTSHFSMSFWRLDNCLTKFMQKIDFSLEVNKTEISQVDLLSTMCHCDQNTGHLGCDQTFFGVRQQWVLNSKWFIWYFQPMLSNKPKMAYSRDLLKMARQQCGNTPLSSWAKNWKLMLKTNSSPGGPHEVHWCHIWF